MATNGTAGINGITRGLAADLDTEPDLGLDVGIDMSMSLDMGPGGADYQDTVTLLQEEILRLEEELRLRDEAHARADHEQAEASPPPESGPEPETAHRPDPAEAQRVAELTAELARRDETIALLFDEIRLIEEAEAAGRAEWEQLNNWVEQVEQRVDSREGEHEQLAAELAEAREQLESQRRSAELERRSSESARRRLEEETKSLRGQLAGLAAQGQQGRASSDAARAEAERALAALEAENVRLRRTCDDLTRQAAAAGEVEGLRARLGEAIKHLEAAGTKVRGLEDELKRTKVEHDAELAALRSQIAREGIQKRDAQAPDPGQTQTQAGADEQAQAETGTTARDWSVVSAEERMAAFRQHLQEVHQREVEERSNNRLSARLSRLWNRTGPKS